MIGKLYLYFGIIGILSVIGWLVAVFMSARYALNDRRTLHYVRAVFIALVAWALASVNSHNVSMIQADRTREMEEARQRQMDARAAEMRALRERAADIRFVEDDRYDYYDLAGVKSDERKSIYELVAEGRDLEPLYRQAGRQERTPGLGHAEPDEEEDQETAARRVRMLPEQERVHATKLARLNLRMSFAVVIIALILLVYDYFSRFNSTFGAVLPLPLSGRAVDHLFPKKHSVLFRAGDLSLVRAYLQDVVRKGESFLYFGTADICDDLNPASVHIPFRRLARDFVSVVKPARSVAGISPLNLAGRARLAVFRLPGALAVRGRLLSAGDRIRMLAIKTWRGIKNITSLVAARIVRLAQGSGLERAIRSASRKALTSTAGIRNFCRGLFFRVVGFAKWRFGEMVRTVQIKDGAFNMHPIRLIPVMAGRKSFDYDFIFESAWFGRHSFVIDDVEMTKSMTTSLLRFLGDRHRPRAAAWRTVHVVWNRDVNMLAREELENLLFLSREANYKLVLLVPDPAASPLKNLVEEVFCRDSDIKGRLSESA